MTALRQQKRERKQPFALDQLGVKMVAVFLFFIYTVFAVFSTLALSFMTQYSFYSASLPQTEREIFTDIGKQTAEDALQRLYGTLVDGKSEDVLSDLRKIDRHVSADLLNACSIHNVCLSLTDESGTVLAATGDGKAPRYAGQVSLSLLEDEEKEIVRTLVYTIPDEMESAGMLYLLGEWLDTLYSARFLIIVICLVSLCASILLYVLLLNAAGHYPNCREPRLSVLDRIPADIMVLLLGGIVYYETTLFSPVSHWWETGWLVPGILFGSLDVLLFLLLSMSIATRFKCNAVMENTLLAVVARVLFGFLRNAWEKVIVPVFRALYHILDSLPLVWKTFSILFGIAAVELVMLLVFNVSTVLLVLWIAEKLVEVPTVLWIVLGLTKLRQGGEALAKGDYQYQIGEDNLRGSLLEHAKNLNSISEGMTRVVEDRMRSERFQTELITNVSHDIKTPLTSIINYVDLLRKQPFSTPEAGEYLNTLDRQAAKLKKLMEDLLEASKASTGNITAEVAPLALDLMLSQAVGEYEERFKAADLSPMLRLPDSTPPVMADGRLLWRVLDNLFSNVVKYALPGSRVYITLTADEERTTLLIRNISKASLNISAEELLQRFVRGDSSRHTEGSGLGLAIAQSLMELMGGQLLLTVDGDLFKVQLRFKPAEPEEKADEEGASPASGNDVLIG